MTIRDDTMISGQHPLARTWVRRLPGDVWRFARRKPLGAIGGAVLLILLATAVFAPVLVTHNPYAISTADRLQAPGGNHWFGADQAGRDIYSRIVYGARTSIVISFSASALSMIIATTFGMLSAYRGGWFDLLVQRLVDAFQAIPGLILLMAATLVFPRGVLTLILLISVLLGIGASRLIRGTTFSIKENDYVTASKALGATDLRIMVKHILPNNFAPIMVLASTEVGAIILLETSLSFLNLGVPPPTVTWGNMLTIPGGGVDGAVRYMQEAPWMLLVPGVAISLAVYGANMLGDALRDTLDPRLRGSG